MNAIVTLTVEAPDGTPDHVSAGGQTYDEAKAAAEALIPEGFKVLVIRTSESRDPQP
ncbi:hypothetical protein [Paenarthrobacter sp. 2TAF44]|uniref:hypothetical protein n=1 Tax=Paenarthrobacter sp. 2TAF44 TaxID=3233018 RepID=UPI003F95926F